MFRNNSVEELTKRIKLLDDFKSKESKDFLSLFDYCKKLENRLNKVDLKFLEQLKFTGKINLNEIINDMKKELDKYKKDIISEAEKMDLIIVNEVNDRLKRRLKM